MTNEEKKTLVAKLPFKTKICYSKRITRRGKTETNHICLAEPFSILNYKREIKDALCKPRAKFTMLYNTGPNAVPDCLACLRRMKKLLKLPEEKDGVDKTDPDYKLYGNFYRAYHINCVACQTFDEAQRLTQLAAKEHFLGLGWRLRVADNKWLCGKCYQKISSN